VLAQQQQLPAPLAPPYPHTPRRAQYCPNCANVYLIQTATRRKGAVHGHLQHSSAAASSYANYFSLLSFILTMRLNT
jgi:hypothetical protein